MASKALKAATKKKAVEMISDPIFKTHIRAQMATAAPPLGPAIGQRGLNVANFCKEFNKVTSNIKPGVVLPVTVSVKPDRTYDLQITTPQTAWLCRQAAGIRSVVRKSGEYSGVISVKHVYEIAKVKSQDFWYQGVPMERICKIVLEECNKLGIKVQREDLDPVEHRDFLEKRQQFLDNYLKVATERETARMLRTTN